MRFRDPNGHGLAGAPAPPFHRHPDASTVTRSMRDQSSPLQRTLPSFLLSAVALAAAGCSPDEAAAAGNEASGTVSAADAAPGAMLTPEELRSLRTDETPAVPVTEAPATPAQPVAKEQAPAPCEDAAQPAAAPAKDSAAAASPADELVALAKELALRPEGLESWLAAHPNAAVGARRDLVLGLAAGVRGETQRAVALLTQVEGRPEIKVAEATALRRLGEGPQALAVAASAADAEPPLVVGAALGATVRRAREAGRSGKLAEAAGLWTEALELQLRAPWHLDLAEMDAWARALAEVQAKRRWNPQGGWPAQDITVAAGDSLISMRKKALETDPQLLVCTGQIARANGLKNERIHPGQKLRVPKDRARVVVDLSAHLVLYYMGEELTAFWPCGVGAQNSPTKAGGYTVGEKTREPMWFRPGAAPVPYGDPMNPLGTRWIEWIDEQGRSSGFGFHGTNEPQSIGRDGSQGCIRMRDADVEELFEIAPKGAKIEVRR